MWHPHPPRYSLTSLPQLCRSLLQMKQVSSRYPCLAALQVSIWIQFSFNQSINFLHKVVCCALFVTFINCWRSARTHLKVLGQVLQCYFSKHFTYFQLLYHSRCIQFQVNTTYEIKSINMRERIYVSTATAALFTLNKTILQIGPTLSFNCTLQRYSTDLVQYSCWSSSSNMMDC